MGRGQKNGDLSKSLVSFEHHLSERVTVAASSSRFWSLQLLPDNCEVLKKPLSHGEDMMRNGVGANLFTPVIFVGTHCSPYKKKATYDHFLSQNKNKERAFSTLRKWSCHSSEMMGVSFWLLVDFLNYVSQTVPNFVSNYGVID